MATVAYIFLWVVIISSAVFLIGYEIWNLIVVSGWFGRLSREARAKIGEEKAR